MEEEVIHVPRWMSLIPCVATSSGTQTVSLWEFLNLDTSKSVCRQCSNKSFFHRFLFFYSVQVIVSMEIPFASADTVFRSYKIMPRSEV